ncbi:MAG: helix-turn-helix transcriptional regulator [Lutibacter sp.]|jgi:AraC-like DNA-binding protein|uniref:AraC family transcriptional regulator n=1 Tax=Lutibacter sp. TaxID=1925666 RepID=UPI00183ECAD2|nr:AraC family transcriptional regulator [Lutibacter sp.]MBT8317605.1 AraC family transcriptional regulator [Lutibacter sp.]NNJ58464.1 helix-turn-helix transcriptional regulator [Lutibacter sp.]
MNNIKPAFEKINPEFGTSIRVKQHSKIVENQLPFWHFHPELELVYVNKGKGKRHIGSHLSYFNNSQLLLIGASLPHSGFTDRFSTNGTETIVQFKEDFLGANFLSIPEMKSIKTLFYRAKKGVIFTSETKQVIGAKIQSLVEKKGMDRIITFLEILQELATTPNYSLLNVDGFAFEIEPQDNRKIDIVFGHVNENFKRPIPLNEISDKVSMTVPAFCRYFKKVTGKTFTLFVNEFRIVHATKLLAENPMSITDVCFESGFNNFSHFNKLFKQITGKTPLKYRNEMKQLLVQN